MSEIDFAIQRRIHVNTGYWWLGLVGCCLFLEILCGTTYLVTVGPFYI